MGQREQKAGGFHRQWFLWFWVLNVDGRVSGCKVGAEGWRVFIVRLVSVWLVKAMQPRD